MKYTKGPWKVVKADGYGWRIEHNSQALITKITTDQCALLDDEENEANAKLIAAAPALLEALKKAREYVAHYGKTTDAQDDRDMIDAAITQATGEV